MPCVSHDGFCIVTVSSWQQYAGFFGELEMPELRIPPALIAGLALAAVTYEPGRRKPRSS